MTCDSLHRHNHREDSVDMSPPKYVADFNKFNEFINGYIVGHFKRIQPINLWI